MVTFGMSMKVSIWDASNGIVYDDCVVMNLDLMNDEAPPGAMLTLENLAVRSVVLTDISEVTARM